MRYTIMIIIRLIIFSNLSLTLNDCVNMYFIIMGIASKGNILIFIIIYYQDTNNYYYKI